MAGGHIWMGNHLADRTNGRRRSPAFPAGWLPRTGGGLSRPTALIRPSDHGGRTVTWCPRRRSPSITSSPVRSSTSSASQVGPARVERGREVAAVEGRCVDGLLQVHPEVHVVEEERRASTGPADRRQECRRRGTARRRAAPGSGEAWCAAACRAPRCLAGRGEGEHLRPGAEAEAEPGDDRGALQPAAARAWRSRCCRTGPPRPGGRCRRGQAGPRRPASPQRVPTRRLARARRPGRVPLAPVGETGQPRSPAAGRPAAAPRRRARPTSAPARGRVLGGQQRRPAGRRRTAGRRTRPRDRRRPAWRTRSRCG